VIKAVLGQNPSGLLTYTVDGSHLGTPPGEADLLFIRITVKGRRLLEVLYVTWGELYFAAALERIQKHWKV